MEIIILADDSKKEEFLKKKFKEGIRLNFVENFSDLPNYNSADAIFILRETDKKDLLKLNQSPVFLNSTIETLKDLNLGENFSRINGWTTFLKRELWEVATNNENYPGEVFKKLDWKYTIVADEPGLVSARIISMIINEAYFALEENVSTKKEIDLAMKLGTNYPFGPFDWAEKIGIKNIYSLLKRLSEKDNSYSVSPSLEKEVNELKDQCH